MQLCLGGQLLDPFSLEDAPGADGEGIDRGGGEVKLGAQTSKSPLYMQSREDCESSQIPIAPVKPGALFPLGSEEPGNQFKSSVFKNADPSNLGRYLIEGGLPYL